MTKYHNCVTFGENLFESSSNSSSQFSTNFCQPFVRMKTTNVNHLDSLCQPGFSFLWCRYHPSLHILAPVKIIFHVSISPRRVPGIDQSSPTRAVQPRATQIYVYIECIHFDEYYRSTRSAAATTTVTQGNVLKRFREKFGEPAFAGRDSNFDVIPQWI